MSQSENPSSNQSSEATGLPPPCAGGCGFYGNKDQKNCCSLCFKKMYPEEFKARNTSNNNNKNNDKNSNDINKGKDEDNESKADGDTNTICKKADKPKKKVQKKKNRCWHCRKKVSLAAQFQCKCGYTFCGMHRYPDAHNCDSMDIHKKQYKDKLAMDNKTAVPSKLDKI